MSTLFEGSAASAAFWLVIKASALLGAVALLQGVLGHRVSAATRHLLWSAAMAGVLLLPVASLALPAWTVVIHTAAPVATPNAAEAPDALSDEAATVLTARGAPPPRALARRLRASLGPQALLTARGVPPPRALGPQAPPSVEPGVTAGHAASPADVPRSSVDWAMVGAGIYATGVAVVLLFVILQHWQVRRILRRSLIVADGEWAGLLAACARAMNVRRPIRLLRSRRQNVPMTFGTRRPSIVIPAMAESWTDDRRRAVLLHEMAHVARVDCLTQTMAMAACAVYWFHPAAWWVARRLRVERELACDDRVIAAGAEARDYATHLLEIAYSFGANRAPALAVGMARRQQLEGRLLAALDGDRNRRVLSRRASAAAAVIALVGVGVVAAARPAVVAADREMPVDTPPRVAGPAAPEPLHEMRGSLPETARRTAGAVAGAVDAPQNGLPGTWEIRPSSTDGMVNLRLVELNSSWGSSVAIDRLEGLTRASLTGPGGPVQFRLKRDAGTFTFEGVLKNGVGAGTFSFAPDPNFSAELVKRGFARPSAAEQYDLARSDVGFAFLDELTAQGYGKPSTPELVKAGQHGVSTTYLKEMGALGYKLGSLQPLITLRDHGVTPTYVRELAELGYKGLSADALRNARDHGVTPDYVRAMRDAGYASLTMEALVNARDHGVTGEFVRQLGDGGFAKVPIEEVVRVRDHGVSPDYLRVMREQGFTLTLSEAVNARDHGVTADFAKEMAALGYKSETVGGLIRMRDHGVSPEFAREMKALGYTNVSAEDLVRLRDHGVSAQFARELQSLGYERPAINDLVSLRDHGLTVEKIKSANARAGTRLPLDLLKSAAAGGWR